MPRHPLAESLLARAERFDFFQAVRLLELARPDAAPVGSGSDPTREAVRFRARVGLEFAVNDIVRGGSNDRHRRGVLEVAFMSLTGSEGTLPAPYCELVLERSRAEGMPGAPSGPDDDARDFLDIFNHRLISLFYRGRKKHRVALGAGGEQVALLERLLFQLIGFNEGVAVRDLYREDSRVPVQPRVLLRYAGMLAGGQRSMAGLQAMLTDALGAPVRGAPAPGRWLPLEERFQTALGGRLGRNHALGVDTVLGGRAWDASGAIALEIGPLDVAQFRALQPGGSRYELLVFMTRFYLREDLDVEVKLTLCAAEVEVREVARLGVDGSGPLRPGARLSRTAWLLGAEASAAEASTAPLQHQAVYMLPRWRSAQPQPRLPGRAA
jgi:type VI secretion system protein ImpH